MFVSECTINFSRDKLRTLSKIVTGFSYKYNYKALVFLADELITEACLPINSIALENKQVSEGQPIDISEDDLPF